MLTAPCHHLTCMQFLPLSVMTASCNGKNDLTAYCSGPISIILLSIHLLAQFLNHSLLFLYRYNNVLHNQTLNKPNAQRNTPKLIPTSSELGQSKYYKGKWFPFISMCHEAPLISKDSPPVLPFGLLQVTQVLVRDVLSSPLIHLLCRQPLIILNGWKRRGKSKSHCRFLLLNCHCYAF